MGSGHQHKKTYYNDIALKLANRILGVEHLHYGYFHENVKPNLSNLAQAQQAYVEFLLSYIPEGVRKILDVGCGTGSVAKQLLDEGYQVCCIAPDAYLIRKTKELTRNRGTYITDLYENVTHIDRESVDLVLMSESCQYVKVTEGWDQNRRFIRPGGYVLIGDFFKIKEIDRPNMSKSGHHLNGFLKAGDVAGFELVEKVDITEAVAPTMDIFQEMISDKAFPVFEALFELAERRYPKTYKVIEKIVRKRVKRVREKYSNQGAALFKEYKGYFVLLFRKRPA